MVKKGTCIEGNRLEVSEIEDLEAGSIGGNVGEQDIRTHGILK